MEQADDLENVGSESALETTAPWSDQTTALPSSSRCLQGGVNSPKDPKRVEL